MKYLSVRKYGYHYFEVSNHPIVSNLLLEDTFFLFQDSNSLPQVKFFCLMTVSHYLKIISRLLMMVINIT